MTGTIVCGVERRGEAVAAARVAGTLARRLGSRLELLYVSRPGARPEPGVISAVQQAVREQLRWDDVELLVESGPAATRVLEAAEHASIVVVGTRSEGALRRALSGSVSTALVRRPVRPVLVVPAAGGGRRDLHGRTIVCGVRDTGDLPGARTAAQLSSELGLATMVVHVRLPVRTPGVPEAAGAPAIPEPAPTELPEALRAGLDTLPAHVGLRVHVGPPGPELARAAAEESAAIIAVGASDHGPLGGALAGSALHHLLRVADRPLLVCPRSAADG